jgi:hypothetical protein
MTTGIIEDNYLRYGGKKMVQMLKDILANMPLSENIAGKVAIEIAKKPEEYKQKYEPIKLQGLVEQCIGGCYNCHCCDAQ